MTHNLYRLVETTPPGAEPLTLEEAKLHLRVSHDAEDALIAEMIVMARQMCETYTGLALMTRSYSLYLDVWPHTASTDWWDGVREGADIQGKEAQLALPRPPLFSVTRINVTTAAGVTAEYPAENYLTDTIGKPGRIVLKQGVSSPSTDRAANGIEIQFKAGYGATAQNIPAALRQAIRQIIAYLYEHRGDDAGLALTASGAEMLLQPFRVMRIS